jgi:2-polyprenyl-3-methyl-5-hydroxy-6-metoxy-1,4-benzoquinol methylase
MTPGEAGQHAVEVAEGRRFEFGANWARFLGSLDDRRIAEAELSLRTMLDRQRLDGLTFLDAGSGSGLFSLAARRLGARVTSFDFDPRSVACTRELQRRYFEGDPAWQVLEGSVLDPDFVGSLGLFDIVYSWGVLHHTGAMRQAIEHAAATVAPGGQLFIAIYNHQVYWTAFYTRLKRTYVSLPPVLRPLISGPFILGQVLKGGLIDVLMLRDPTRRYRDKVRDRGMSVWHDWIDWVGGYPFEAAKPEEIFAILRGRGFQLDRLITCGGGLGCNQFVFNRVP